MLSMPLSSSSSVEGLRSDHLSPPSWRFAASSGGASPSPESSTPAFHEPVMAKEVLTAFASCGSGVIVDATVGAGGHAAIILREKQGVTLLGLDRDREALLAAARVLKPFGRRALLVKDSFDHLGAVVRAHEPSKKVVGVLFDLGVSSMQIDHPERGFSYMRSGPLDMRMDRSNPLTAEQIVNSWPVEELERLFRLNGEVSLSRRISAAVVAARPLESTGELADVVARAVPARSRRRPGHPAKRVFQAIRRAVNEEDRMLSDGLEQAIELLDSGGRCVVLSYHSSEDRAVKAAFAHAASGGCTCPAGLPCVCGAVGVVRVITKGALKPQPDEVAANSRAASARLRIAERLDRARRSS